MPDTPPIEDARSHLRAEMARLANSLAELLAGLRHRGKTPAGEALRGFVIEDGEAEGLVKELSASWAGKSNPALAPEPSDPTTLDQAGSLEGETLDDRVFLPLRHATRNFELSRQEYDALLLALAVELDARFGRIVAYLNDHVGRSRPTLGLALSLSRKNSTNSQVSPLAFRERLAVRDGLLELDGEGAAPELFLRLAPSMALRLAGDASPFLLPEGFRLFPPEPGLMKRLVLEQHLRETLDGWVQSRLILKGAASLVLSGLPGAGRATAARAVMGELGWPLLVIDVPADCLAERLRQARREARWQFAPLFVRVTPPSLSNSVDWTALWMGLAHLHFPVIVGVLPEMTDALIGAATQPPMVVRLPETTLAARAAVWRELLPPHAALSDADLDQLAARFRFNPGRIQLAIDRTVAAKAFASADRESGAFDRLLEACRELGSAAMGSLAQKLPLPFEWSELVVPAALRSELDLARTWVKQQRTVLDNWGFGRRLSMGYGLTLLFSGPPGTGKTMAAQVLSRELGLDLYRVDLSRVVNKYIGETEKNLARLFDEAQASGAVLFFDEADALFGKRSEVKSAHDRYANLEVGYLLQRMEEYEGVTILASNRARDMDEAFTRRFQFLIDFPLPDEKNRLEIWKGMIPAGARSEPNLDLASLAKEFQVSGGEIKNSVLAAAFIAAGEGRPIGMSDLRRALRREFSKNGRVLAERGLV